MKTKVKAFKILRRCTLSEQKSQMYSENVGCIIEPGVNVNTYVLWLLSQILWFASLTLRE